MHTIARFRPSLVLIGLALSPSMIRAQAPRVPAQATSRLDSRLEPLRKASASWATRTGPTRRVVDQVCLVPDVATYYEALATWDEAHFFPILIDDVDLTLKFLHAFKPARIVRYPGKGREAAGADKWEVAVKAVGEAWTAADAPAGQRLRGDARPSRLGKTPPAVVVARPTSESLPGLAALAAGRFQPLVRVDIDRSFGDVLDPALLRKFLDAFDAAIRARSIPYDRLGDDCDFVTLAGDYPYRYNGPRGLAALDDRVAWDEARGERWAFTGRLMGDARRSVYAAMCSLFVQPESALLFNAYPEDAPPWSIYNIRPAYDHLRAILPTKLAAGDRQANLRGWHDVFDPGNKFGLILMNTKGTPSHFELFGGPGHAYDVLPSVPTAVCMIHSYSAADPTNAGMVAGRWLAQGAFLYHGSLDEPFLPAFRPLSLVADLIAEGMPFGAAVRVSTAEAPRQTPYAIFGEPWKLVLLGDPLYTLVRRTAAASRDRDYAPTASWTVYEETSVPPQDATELTRVAWALNAAFVRQTVPAANESADDLIAVLRTVDRGRLDAGVRPVYDELLVELLYRSNRLGEVGAVVEAIPAAERTATVTRLGISAAVVDLQHAVVLRDVDRAGLAWAALVRGAPEGDFVKQITARVSGVADTPRKRATWRDRLQAAASGRPKPEVAGVIAGELKKVDEAIKGGR